jgi:hypothetical protein
VRLGAALGVTVGEVLVVGFDVGLGVAVALTLGEVVGVVAAGAHAAVTEITAMTLASTSMRMSLGTLRVSDLFRERAERATSYVRACA